MPIAAEPDLPTRSVTLALAIAMAGAYGVFSDAKASADSAASAIGNNNSPDSPETATPATGLKKTRLVFGDSGRSLAVGTFVLIDGTTLTCPGTSGTCTYSGSNWLQIDANATSNWTLATAVDGNLIGVGPFLGPLPMGTGRTIGHEQHTFRMPRLSPS
jgi:hypothetical protein